MDISKDEIDRRIFASYEPNWRTLYDRLYYEVQSIAEETLRWPENVSNKREAIESVNSLIDKLEDELESIKDA